MVLRIYHNEKVWWGVKFLKVTGAECATLTDDVDLFDAYDLYNEDEELTDEKLEALFSSLDPTQGLQKKQSS